MRHFWFTDEDGENILDDYRGDIDGALKVAEDASKKYGTIYVNEGDDIVEVVFA